MQWLLHPRRKLSLEIKFLTFSLAGLEVINSSAFISCILQEQVLLRSCQVLVIYCFPFTPLLGSEDNIRQGDMNRSRQATKSNSIPYDQNLNEKGSVINKRLTAFVSLVVLIRRVNIPYKYNSHITSMRMHMYRFASRRSATPAATLIP